MKKTLHLFIALMCVSFLGYSQTITNGDFEAWAGTDPDSWGSCNTNMSALSLTPVTQATGETGNGVQMETTDASFFSIAGILVNGTYNVDQSQTETITGASFTTRPEVITFDYTYAPAGSDNCQVTVELKNSNGLCANGTFTQSSAVSTFTEATITLNYVNAETPEEIILIFQSSKARLLAAAAPEIGSIFIVDNVAVSGEASDVGELLIDNLKIYPNPAKQELTLNLTNNKLYDVSIANLVGQEVLNTKISGTATLNTSKLQSGLYMLKISSENKKITKKIIIE